ncbi:MAG: O-antigen ligase family protein [Bacteroidetes bacterium]|nr:MAG: O-antigen ligase family protein [Bacteroidota bacterium]
MAEYFKNNYQFLILCFLWVVTGMVGGTIAASVIILASVILLKRKELYQEIFLGLLVILILSDSRYKPLAFVADVKVIYIPLLSVFLFFDREKFTVFDKLVYLFTPFLLIALFLIPFSDNWLISMQKFVSYALLMFIASNYLIKIYQEKGSIFFKNIIYLFTLVLLLGLILKYVNPDIATLKGRYRGIFGNPNGLGLFCTLFFLLYYVVHEYFPDLFSRVEKTVVYFVIILSVFFSGSRSTITSIFIFLIFTRLYKLSPFLGFIILCLITIGYELVFINLTTMITSVGLDEYFRIQSLETGSGRNIAWSFAWEQIQHNFFLGKGFAYDELLFDKHYDELAIRGHQGNVHNSYLTIWINTGIMGLIFFMRGFFLAFLKGAKNSRLAFPVMFAVLFSANFESWLAASLNPFTVQLWIILTLLGSMEFNEKKNEDIVPVH